MPVLRNSIRHGRPGRGCSRGAAGRRGGRAVALPGHGRRGGVVPGRPQRPGEDQRGGYRAQWTAAARDAGLPGISSFAKGLEQDLDAVPSGLTMNWSSGPVEGRVNF
jgi:hypothetical protein